MAVSSKANATAVFDLKSAALTVLALLLKTAEMDRLAEALSQRLGANAEAFQHEPLCLDLAALRDADAALDFDALLALLRQHGFNPIAVRGGSVAQMAAAEAVGLVEAPERPALPRERERGRRPEPEAAVVEPPSVDAPGPDPAAQAAAAVVQADVQADGQAAIQPDTQPDSPVDTQANTQATEQTSQQTTKQATKQSTPQAALKSRAQTEVDAGAPVLGVSEILSPSGVRTLIIDRPLRSGQQVYARGGDLIVMAVVSFGAEVIADGNIHVYAPLRGRALAGARGDVSARIFAAVMEPQLVSIAGTWRNLETSLAPEVAGKPAQVRLDGDKLLFEPLKF